MRLFNILLLLILLSSSVYAQNKPADNAVVKPETKTETKTEKKSDIKTEPKGDAAATKEEKKDTIEKIPDGYGNVTWGMYLSDARGKIAGILTYTDEKTVIVAKDKELQFQYGFFYKEPSAEKKGMKNTEPPKDEGSKNPAKDETAKTDTDTAAKKDETSTDADKRNVTDTEKDEGRLFYVSMSFPYLDKNSVYDRIQKKYGKHTGENMKDNQGAIAWDSENTIIIMWVDRYEKKPFCRRIIYISKKISKELNEYNNTIFNKTEIDLIKTMNP